MQLIAYFFPVVFAIPLFGSYLAENWLWTFTPSLSYIGQGKLYAKMGCIYLTQIHVLPGIIMGFPTTLSMSLVCLSCIFILSVLTIILGVGYARRLGGVVATL